MLQLVKLGLTRFRSPQDYQRMQRYVAEGSLDRIRANGVDLASARTLELGAGAGGYSTVLRDVCAELVATDFQRADEFPDDVPFRTVDVQQPFPFDDASFDLVYCSSLIEHVRDPGFVVAECRRVLRPGGHLYLSFPPYWSLAMVGGHNFKPFHLLGERLALRIHNARHRTAVPSFAEAYDGYGLHPLRVRDGRVLLDGAGFAVLDTYTRLSRVNTARLPGILSDLLTWHVCYLARRPVLPTDPAPVNRS